MLVLNFLLFLPNSMILAIFMQEIKIRAILNLKLKGLHENVQNFCSMCVGSREIAKKTSGNSIGGHPVVLLTPEVRSVANE